MYTVSMHHYFQVYIAVNYTIYHPMNCIIYQHLKCYLIQNLHSQVCMLCKFASKTNLSQNLFCELKVKML